MPPTLRMYGELAPWWPLLSPPAEYAGEAEACVELLGPPAAGTRPALLELGSGGGNLASHLRRWFDLTLSDLSRGMLEVSRGLLPGVEHVEGDMRTLRLGRRFDVVLVHDAIMYCTSPADVRATLATAAAHLGPGGRVLVVPDHVRESFVPETSAGGGDGADGRALRYLEWSYDPDPSDCTVETMYSIVTRDASGEVRAVLDRHIEGLFPMEEWRYWFAEAGLPARAVRDRWDREVFVGVKAAEGDG